MSFLGRLFRRREAMDEWSSGLERRTRTAAPAESRTPDAEPEDVPYPGRVGFDGKRIEPGRGGLTGLEGGNAGGPKPPAVPNA